MILVFQVQHDRGKLPNRSFDSDSALVGTDNRASACISDTENDFVPGTLVPCNRVVKGFGGSKMCEVMKGTLRWKIADNDGMVHAFLIPGSHCIPDGNVRLFCPQHWAKTRNDHHPKRHGPRSVTTDSCVDLQWFQHRCRLTVPIDPAINVASFNLAPGFEVFSAFVKDAGLTDDHDPVCTLPSMVVSDTEDSDDDDDEPPSIPKPFP